MSYNTLAVQVTDQALRDRVNAAIHQEAIENPAVADTVTAKGILTGAAGVVDQFVWPVSLNTEGEYESALAGGNENPGGDESVISDQMILSAVQANWPPDPT